MLTVRQCTVAPLVSNHADKRSSSASRQLLDVPGVRSMSRPDAIYWRMAKARERGCCSRSRSFRPLPFSGSRRISVRLLPDGNLCRTPYAPALVASVGLGAQFSGAHWRHVCGPAMRATRIAHRLEGFCRNGSRKATWLERRQIALSDAALRAIRMYPFRGLGHIIEGSNAESANAQVGERFNDANVD